MPKKKRWASEWPTQVELIVFHAQNTNRPYLLADPACFPYCRCTHQVDTILFKPSQFILVLATCWHCHLKMTVPERVAFYAKLIGHTDIWPLVAERLWQPE